MSVEVTVDDKIFRQKMEQYKKTVGQALPQITNKGGNKYAEWSMMYVPPKNNGSWSKRINAKAYKRPILYIPQLIKDTKSKAMIAILRRQLQNKNKYAVKKQPYNSKIKWFFGKTKNELRKYTQILNRGLLKVMFGANLYKVGIPIPNAILNILNKSPNLRKYVNMNFVKMNYQVNKSCELLTSNEATVKLGYSGNHAIKEGCYRARAAMVNLMKQKVNEVTQKWNQ